MNLILEAQELALGTLARRDLVHWEPTTIIHYHVLLIFRYYFDNEEVNICYLRPYAYSLLQTATLGKVSPSLHVPTYLCIIFRDARILFTF